MPSSLSQVRAACAKPQSPFHGWAQAPFTQAPVFVEPPPHVITPGNITASPGQNVVMSCVVLGDVPYNLTWSWDGKVAQPGEGRTRLLQNSSLEIIHVQPGDGGLYECVAQSANGTATASLWLFIQGRLCPSVCPWPGGCSAAPRGGGEWHPGG